VKLVSRAVTRRHVLIPFFVARILAPMSHDQQTAHAVDLHRFRAVITGQRTHTIIVHPDVMIVAQRSDRCR
jgi:hypothetical protein